MAKTISLSIPDDLLDWLSDIAIKEGKKIQEVIREVLYEYRTLKKYKVDKLVSAVDSMVGAFEKLSDLVKREK